MKELFAPLNGHAEVKRKKILPEEHDWVRIRRDHGYFEVLFNCKKCSARFVARRKVYEIKYPSRTLKFDFIENSEVLQFLLDCSEIQVLRIMEG
jgi:hypothetical protein